MTNKSTHQRPVDLGGLAPAALLAAMVQKDFISFVAKAFDELGDGPLERSGYLELIGRKMEQVIANDVRRLIVNLPPRVLKSHIVSVCLPAFILGKNPSESILLISHSEDLAERLSYKCMKLMQSDWYRSAFPATLLAPDFARRDHFMTTRGGELIATPLGGAITGNGGKIIIIDDPLDAQNADSEKREQVNRLYSTKIQSRLNNLALGRIIVVAQRLHPDDLCGFLIRQGMFELLSVPLVAEERIVYRVGDFTWDRPAGDVLRPQSYTPEEVYGLRRTLPPHVFLTQYQQTPTLVAAGLVKAEWFPDYDAIPSAAQQTIVSWDLGQTDGPNSSYSVALVFRTDGQRLFLADIWRDRVDFQALDLHARDLLARYAGAIHVVEEAALGYALKGVLTGLGVRVEGVRATTSKQARLEAVLDLLHDGRVSLPRHASWRGAFLDEIGELPHSRFDDQGDALSQMLSWFRNDFKPRPPPSFGHGGFPGPNSPKRNPMRDPRAGPMNFIPGGGRGFRR